MSPWKFRLFQGFSYKDCHAEPASAGEASRECSELKMPLQGVSTKCSGRSAFDTVYMTATSSESFAALRTTIQRRGKELFAIHKCNCVYQENDRLYPCTSPVRGERG